MRRNPPLMFILRSDSAWDFDLANLGPTIFSHDFARLLSAPESRLDARLDLNRADDCQTYKNCFTISPDSMALLNNEMAVLRRYAVSTFSSWRRLPEAADAHRAFRLVPTT